MDFDWDPAKARSNLAKHRISFELATRVWDDPRRVRRFDRTVNGEDRWHAIGLVNAAMVLLVVHAYPQVDIETRVRIISARKASREERDIYGH